MLDENVVKHRWLDRFCGLLERTVNGLAAEQIKASGAAKGIRRSAVVALPTWAWIPAAAATVGGKAAPVGGRIRLLPVRLVWDPSPVLIVARSETVTARWRAVGLGCKETGTTVITADSGADIEAFSPFPPAHLAVGLTSAVAARNELTRLVEDGKTGMWEAVQVLEPYVLSAVVEARSRVARELNPDRPPILLDRLDLETLANSLVLGDEGGATSALSRMIERCAAPDTFAKVDPLRYVRSTIRRDAEQALRRRIGDPFIGPKVRKTARQLGRIDLDEIVETYRSRWPADRLGSGRAAAALELTVTDVSPAFPIPDMSHLERSA